MLGIITNTNRPKRIIESLVQLKRSMNCHNSLLMEARIKANMTPGATILKRVFSIDDIPRISQRPRANCLSLMLILKLLSITAGCRKTVEIIMNQGEDAGTTSGGNRMITQEKINSNRIASQPFSLL